MPSDVLRSWENGAGGVALSEPQRTVLLAYAEMVASYNKAMNLTAAATVERFLESQVLDALQLSQVWTPPPGARCLDIGSGAGLPGAPLAILWPETRWVLLERRQKRVAFLDLLRARLKLINVEVVCGDASSASLRERFGRSCDLVTLKAVADREGCRRLADPYLAPGGRLILPRTAEDALILAQRRKGAEEEPQQVVEDGQWRIHVIRSTERTWVYHVLENLR